MPPSPTPGLKFTFHNVYHKSSGAEDVQVSRPLCPSCDIVTSNPALSDLAPRIIITIIFPFLDASVLARQGTSKTQHDEQVSYATSKQIVQTKSRKIWHDRWARGNTGRIYYQHQQTPNQTDPIKNYTEHIRLPYFASEHTMHR